AGKSVDDIVSFFKESLPSMVGEDSYGMLYIYDDEGGHKVDEFETYILRKGVVTQERDVYFSPFSKMVSPEGISQF
ncbi:MAG: Imm7 family immunity protein, partial [Bacteroidota bacterium]